ncbi:hypothetical protein FIBSPDRAFT_902328 [Athelia psychrophila]|uniref:Uncharacterized protein n=1 Tax=Athelia psychrophila TaxID=1759441 RepID=A0A167XD88_9AGAM|nr:hypothetical protein FIBSPDRAFT_902328 [Fibularhizoctonia sp. CBS 109695]
MTGLSALGYRHPPLPPPAARARRPLSRLVGSALAFVMVTAATNSNKLPSALTDYLRECSGLTSVYLNLQHEFETTRLRQDLAKGPEARVNDDNMARLTQFRELPLDLHKFEREKHEAHCHRRFKVWYRELHRKLARTLTLRHKKWDKVHQVFVGGNHGSPSLYGLRNLDPCGGLRRYPHRDSRRPDAPAHCPLPSPPPTSNIRLEAYFLGSWLSMGSLICKKEYGFTLRTTACRQAREWSGKRITLELRRGRDRAWEHMWGQEAVHGTDVQAVCGHVRGQGVSMRGGWHPASRWADCVETAVRSVCEPTVLRVAAGCGQRAGIHRCCVCPRVMKAGMGAGWARVRGRGLRVGATITKKL